jgi:hypothetical protein
MRMKKEDRSNGLPYERIWSSEPRIGNGRAFGGASEAQSPIDNVWARGRFAITTVGGIRQETTNKSGVKRITPLLQTRAAVWIASLDCQYIKTTRPRSTRRSHGPPRKRTLERE